MMKDQDSWEGTGAASGLLAGILFVLAFLELLQTNPSGDNPLPTIENADSAPAYLAANLTSYRLETLFTTLGIVLFLWFVGTVQSTLRAAEGAHGRGTALAVIGASVGSALMLVGTTLSFTAGLSTSPSQASAVPAIYTASAVAFALGGGALSVFLFAVGKVVLTTGAMPRWLGWLALAAAVLASLAFMAPFFEAGILNAATCLLGRWAWWGAFVLWVLLAGISLTVKERRQLKGTQADETSTHATPEEAGAR
jgi:hypothetical protein